jgi:hypothetical protein
MACRLIRFSKFRISHSSESGGYFTPDSRLLRMYISLSALLTVPNGIIGAGVVAAAVAAAAGFFAWWVFAKAVDADRLRIARLTMIALFMLELLWDRERERAASSASPVFGIDTSPPPAPSRQHSRSGGVPQFLIRETVRRTRGNRVGRNRGA